MVNVKKMSSYWVVFLLSIAVLFSFKTHALQSEPSVPSSEILESPVSAELISEIDSIQPGKPFWVAVRLKMQDHWHSYWKNPGEAGSPTSIEWKLPQGYSASPILWPTPERFDIESIVGYGYENQVVLLTEITPPQNENSAVSVIGASVRWLACSDTTCLPGSSDITLSIPVKNIEPSFNAVGASLISEAKRHLPIDNWGELSASKKYNLLEIVVKADDSLGEPTSALFFPENPNLIDNQIEPTITRTDQNTYIIALKESECTEEKPVDLKGVLVLRENNKNIIKSLEINTPLLNDQTDAFLSINESSPSREVVIPSSPSSLFSEGFFFYLITAFIGGVILNLMPCVLPVVSLKIMNFVKMAGEEKSKILMHGGAFAMGVLVSFWLLAGILITLQTYGHSVGWGFQLQQPIVIASLAILILIFGLSMFGVFEVGTSVASWAGQAQSNSQKSGNGFLSSFMGGVLATAMATPCTGPFLGPAVGFAATQPPILGLIIFTSLGLGMAFPYLLLSAFPQFLKFMPKPGNWMVTFREVTGFIMMAVVLWLLWVFGAQTDNIALFLLMASLLIFSVGCWIYGKWAMPWKSKVVRTVGTVLALTCFLAGGNVAYQAVSKETLSLDDLQPLSMEVAQSTKEWKRFDAVKLDQLQSVGTPVLVDFTAKWCMICQANHLAFSADKVDTKLQELGVVKMKADWTKYDPAITEELKKYGRNGVPLYLLFTGDPNKPPEILPQVLTPAVILNYLNTIQKPL